MYKNQEKTVHDVITAKNKIQVNINVLLECYKQ